MMVVVAVMVVVVMMEIVMMMVMMVMVVMKWGKKGNKFNHVILRSLCVNALS